MEIKGLGQLLAALAAALFLRVVAAGAGPALLPPAEDEEGDVEAGEGGGGGGVRPVTIRWARVTCALKNKRGDMARFLLSNLSGEAKPGRLLALMGPSGSGKTTLLNVLAGQLTASPSLHLSGFLYVNGQPMSQGGYKIAYVRQEDIFFSQLTVRETLSLAAELQLHDTMSPERKEKYVNDLLFRLGLVNSADSIVGDAKVRGISGGEKKRLSLACELIASPSVIFADEPTTEGEVVYMGPAKEEPLKYFASLGYQCPDHENPAEFLADLISTDYSSAESVQSSQKRIENLIDEFANKVLITEFNSPVTQSEGSEISTKLAQKSTRKQRRGWWRQFRLLFKRAWMQAFRDGPTNKVRARMSVASAIIFGSVFWRMGKTQTSIQDRMGLLQVTAINTAMAALTKTVGVFPKERAIVDRERAKGSYALGPYLSSKLLAEIPIGAAFPLIFGSILYPMARLHPTVSRFAKFCGIVTVESFAASAMGLTVGAIAPTTEAAMALGPSLMTVFIVFGGYYVNPDNTPVIFRWIPKASLIRWAFQGLCINEFKGLQFEHQHSYDVQTGEQALERFSLGGIRIADTLVAQGRILMFWYWLTYLLLKKNRARYQQLLPPSEEDQSKQQTE
ncbi:hypothetical protein VPH35_042089 [Triticum aestivum]|uniref:ABC transporter domain-containing protein n=1 Tax=Triticum aestivum TaxID=4565 RepID=A0A3B6EA47_WHEAT